MKLLLSVQISLNIHYHDHSAGATTVLHTVFVWV